MADWFRSVGIAIADWIAPERGDIDELMKAVEAEELASGAKVEPMTLAALRDFVKTGRTNG